MMDGCCIHPSVFPGPPTTYEVSDTCSMKLNPFWFYLSGILYLRIECPYCFLQITYTIRD